MSHSRWSRVFQQERRLRSSCMVITRQVPWLVRLPAKSNWVSRIAPHTWKPACVVAIFTSCRRKPTGLLPDRLSEWLFTSLRPCASRTIIRRGYDNLPVQLIRFRRCDVGRVPAFPADRAERISWPTGYRGTLSCVRFTGKRLPSTGQTAGSV